MNILYTDNFVQNLDSIDAYWRANQYPQGFDRLLEELENSTLKTLEQFPRIGRVFALRPVLSAQASIEVQSLGLDQEVREYLMKDYLLLYSLPVNDSAHIAPTPHTLYLLAIKHHLQLSFDLPQFMN